LFGFSLRERKTEQRYRHTHALDIHLTLWYARFTATQPKERPMALSLAAYLPQERRQALFADISAFTP